MPATTTSVPVSGTVRRANGDAQLVLTDRIGGYDTFLSGKLEFAGRRIAVRIITLDDITVLRPLDQHDVADIGPTWAGQLHLPHGARARSIPVDLATIAAQRQRTLDELDDAELRYALTFLEEATTTRIRHLRIEAIVSALPCTDASDPIDLGGSNDAG